jgi:tetratricopeptide (TPR) repeat protein
MTHVAPWITPQQRAAIAQELRCQQRAHPTKDHISHDIGLLWFWIATTSLDRAERRVAWCHVIANWTPLLESDTYWQTFAQQRQFVYGGPVAPDRWRDARQAVLQRVHDQLLEYDGKEHAQAPTLSILFEIEMRAYRALASFGGLSLGEVTFACGPLLAHNLGLIPDVALKARELYGLDPNRPALAELLTYFSELAPAALLVNDAPEEALIALTTATCAICNQPLVPTAPLRTAITPRVCGRMCAAFAERNPAYALIPNSDQLLRRAALLLTAEAIASLAEIALHEPTPDFARISAHWRDMLDAATAADQPDDQRGRVAELALRRSDALQYAEQPDTAIAMLETAYALVDDERLRTSLANLLMRRGRMTRKADRPIEALSDLQRALDLDKESEQIREQMLIALLDAFKIATTQAEQRQFLKNLNEVLAEGLRIHPQNKNWREFYEETYDRSEPGQPHEQDEELELHPTFVDDFEEAPLPYDQTQREIEIKVTQRLEILEQRYEQQAAGIYRLPSPRGSDLPHIDLEITRDVVSLSVVLQIEEEDIEQALTLLPDATRRLFCCKIALDADNEVVLMAQVPFEALGTRDLAQIIYDLQLFGTIPNAKLLQESSLNARIDLLRYDSYWYRKNTVSSADLYRPRRQARNTAHDLPLLCEKLGVPCKTESEGRFILMTSHNEELLEITAECKGKRAVRFGIRFELPQRSRRFRSIAAQLNNTLTVCNALASDHVIEFLYDLPNVDEKGLRQMITRMHECAARYSFDFVF